MLGVGRPFSSRLLHTGRAPAQKCHHGAALLFGEALLVLRWDEPLRSGRSWRSSRSNGVSAWVGFWVGKAAFEEAPMAGVSVEVGFRGVLQARQPGGLRGGVGPAAPLGIGGAGPACVMVALSDG